MSKTSQQRGRLVAGSAARWTRNLAETAGLVSLGVGLWWLSPAWCLVIVGGLVLGLSIVGRLR